MGCSNRSNDEGVRGGDPRRSTMASSPYEKIPAPSFALESPDARDGERMPIRHVSATAGGGDASPELSWSGYPDGTRSFVVTMFDPDAPTPSGFWHWALVDIPAGEDHLPEGAGSGHGLPAGAFQLRNDVGQAGYLGPAPPAGHGRHRYFIAVHAVDVESLGLAADATPAYLSFNLAGHTLARAVIVPWFEVEAAQRAA
jgi:Raf kinase inhibitor-like YbhB/YbcL family protein